MKKVVKTLQRNKPNFQVFIMAIASVGVSVFAIYVALIAIKISGNS